MEHKSATHGSMGGMDMSRSSTYGMFFLNLAASAIIMYFVMYTMINSTDELYNNLNNVYMTMMMVASMAILMLWMMKSMFPDRKLNLLLYIGFAAFFALGFGGMQTQALVGDRQFLRAMIPHHSGAVLMCQRSKIQDPEILSLCTGIVASQKQEIGQMKSILSRK